MRRFLAEDTYCVYLLIKTALWVFSNIQGPVKESFNFGLEILCEGERFLCEDTKPEKRSVETDVI